MEEKYLSAQTSNNSFYGSSLKAESIKFEEFSAKLKMEAR